MDEVRTDRLLAKHGKDTILVLIRDWPNSEKYKGKHELVVSLEYLVSMPLDILIYIAVFKHFTFYIWMSGLKPC